MTKTEIVEAIAKDSLVEQVCRRITHLAPESAEAQDLSQYIYLILLEYREDFLVELWERNEIDNLIARLVLNNFRSGKSRFHYLFRVFRERSVPLTGMDFPDNPQ